MTSESQAQASATTSDDGSAVLSIGDLAERTGLNAATLRMWESRHGFPVPHRLESGHRRYREEDVAAVAAVVRHKDAGTRLELAILNAMADAEPTAPSVYAFLRRRHPEIGVHRLKKSTLIALSWAIEDEFCAKADRAAIYASFQLERYYRSAEPRWTELARVARKATVFADFAESDPEARPVEVAL
ncbi:MAG: MerR family transcriptional regulator, partial [Ornithinibacter sp.]